MLARGCGCFPTNPNQGEPCSSCRCPTDTPSFGKGDTGYYDPQLQAYLEQPTKSAGRRLNYIFSPDARTRISGTTTFPWRTIGQLDMQATNGKDYTCSGATVGSRAILTAGHCVHSGPGGSGWYNVQFSAGRNGGTNPYGTLPWSHITTYQAWTNSNDWR